MQIKDKNWDTCSYNIGEYMLKETSNTTADPTKLSLLLAYVKLELN